MNKINSNTFSKSLGNLFLSPLLFSLFIFLGVHSSIKAQSCGYSFQKTITIDHNQVAGTASHIDFPVLISVTDNDLRNTGSGGDVVNVNGFDIAFLGESGEQLAHQIESYNSTTGELVAWVKLPVLYTSFDTQIQLVYGNASITAEQSTTVTFSKYAGVYHLHDDFNDSSPNGNTGTNSGSADQTSAQIADGQTFGALDYVEVPTTSMSTASGSVTVWANASSFAATEQYIIGHTTNPAFANRIQLYTDDAAGNLDLGLGNSHTLNTGIFDFNTSEWYHVGLTWDGSDYAVYVNGNLEATGTYAGLGTFNTFLDIGNDGATSNRNEAWRGDIDETRVTTAVLDSSWMRTEYRNQNSPSTFYSIGTEQAGTFTPTIPTCGYNFRKTITINNAQVAGTGSHIDFPVLISLTDNDLRTTANGGDVESSSGFDIVFTDDNLVPLDFQVEEYNASTGELVAWVKVPALPTASDYEIGMFYGNANAFADPSTQCTWSNDYQGVWHLNDDFLDGTTNGNDGTNNGSTDNTGGAVADCQSLDGTNDFIQLGNSGMVAPNVAQTISIWANFSSVPVTSQNFLSVTNNASSSAVQLGYRTNSLAWQFGGGTLVSSGGTESINTWHHYVYTFDGTTHRFYVDGGAPTTSTTSPQTAVPNDAEIGRWSGGSEFFGGLIDEMRYSTAVKSDGWITTEYNNINNPGTFYSVGSETTLAATSIANADWDQTTTWNTGSVPGLGANITIQHNVDLDDRDVVICNLTIEDNSGGGDARLQVENGRTMTVEENANMSLQSAGDDVILRVQGGNSKLIINGDLFIDHDGGDDVFTDVEDAGDSLIVRGNFLLEHDGGDNLDIRVDDPAAVMLVEGNTVANMNSGVDDIMEFDLNSGRFIVNGNFTGRRLSDFEDFELDMDGATMQVDSLFLISSGGGGNDQILVMVDEASTLNANYFRMEMGGGDDHQLDVNVNGGDGGTLQINGNMDIVKTGGDDLFFRVDDDNSVFRVTGNLDINSTGAEEIQIQINSDATFDVDGNMTITHSEGELCHIFTEGIGGASPTFNVDGNFDVNWNGGGDLFNPDLEGGVFSIGGSLNVTNTTGSGNVWFDCDGGNITVTDTFFANNFGDQEYLIDLDGGTILSAGTFIGVLSATANDELLIDVDEDCQFNVTGNMELEANTGNDFEFHLGENTTNSTAQLNVGGDLLFDHNGLSGVDDLKMNIRDDAVVTINGSFTMSTNGSSGTGNFQTNLFDNGELSVNGNLILDNSVGSNFLQIVMNNSSRLELGGNVVRNASPNNFGLISSTATTTTIEYDGTGSQVFADEDGAGTDGIEYELVVINNSFGTEPQLTMEAPVTLSNSITFTDGVLQTTSVNLLSIADGGVTNGGSANSFVSGPVRKIGDDNFIFPLGDGGVWARLEITDLQNTPTVTDEFTASYSRAQHPQGFLDSADYGGNDGGMTNVSIVEFWEVTRDNGDTRPKIRLYWEDGAASFINNLPDLTVAHLTGATAWTNEGGTTSGTVAAGTVTTTSNLDSFSPFTFGSTNASVNPLPIELLFFEAEKQLNTVQLNWTTLTEINNDYFTIERSFNAIDFKPIAQVEGAGNSSNSIDYSVFDEDPLDGLSYYRLKQTDFNGEFTYSSIVAVDFGQSNQILIYPNPSKQGSIINIEGLPSAIERLAIYSSDGQEVVANFLQRDRSAQIISSGLKKGLYFIKITFSHETYTGKLIVD